MTHTGEEFFTLGWQDYSFLVLVLAVYVFLSLRNKLPGMQAFKDFADVINSAGGNILLLSVFCAWSIKIAMQFFYHLLSLPDDRLSKADAITTAGIAFVTGSLFGLFGGALIKTLTGGKANGTLPGAAPAATPGAPLPGGATPIPAVPPTPPEPVAPKFGLDAVAALKAAGILNADGLMNNTTSAGMAPAGAGIAPPAHATNSGAPP